VAPSWSERYGERHRLVRIADFPVGITAPKKVRLYFRCDHFVLQWWDPATRQNQSDRVDGDLVTAISHARQIEERLTHFRRSGQGRRRVSHGDLVQQFLADVAKRADAGIIDPATLRRYRSALRHYESFCQQNEIRKAFPYAASVNRDFRLSFAAFLSSRRTTANGRPGADARPMKGQAFVLDAVRAMLQWAGDPERGNLFPDGFRNPFHRSAEERTLPRNDPLAEPDITLPMALAFVRACDLYQLRLFTPMLLFGLRAAEPCFLFGEYLDDSWLRVPCNSDLEYLTKSRRSKKFPLIEDLLPFWKVLRPSNVHGLLYVRRGVLEGREESPWQGASLAELVAEFRARCAAVHSPGLTERQRLRDGLLHEAGGIRYDHVEQEFHTLAQKRQWPAQATLKDFRHLFCTTMTTAGLPGPYLRFLMGHAPERAAIAVYTHLPDLRRHYTDAVRREWPSLLEAVLQRLDTLGSDSH
jgi:hypothetical protein